MIHIFVDFEMNSIAKELFDEIENCHMEIIEIGAVALDSSLNEIGSYKKYIKPQYNDHIMPRYVELTGINDRTVADAKEFSDVFFDFLAWCGLFDGADGYQIYSWSKCDRDQLKRELKQKKIAVRKLPDVRWMLCHWSDYQKEFSSLIGSGHPISLDKAVSALDVEFIGRKHDALCDARNTARLFVCAHDTENFKKRVQKIKEFLLKSELHNNENDSTEEAGEIVSFAKHDEIKAK